MPVVGDDVRLGFTATSGGVLVDPSPTPVLTVTRPDGTTATPTVVRSSLGRFTAVYTATLPGRHVWSTAGPGVDPRNGVFNVAETSPPSIIGLAELKAYLNITDTVDDDELRGYAAAATAIVEMRLNQTIARRTVVEPRRIVSGWAVLSHVPVIAVTAASDGTTSWDPSVLAVEPVTGFVWVATGPGWGGTVTITYTAGYQVIPQNVLLAASIVAGHLWSTQRMAMLGGQPTFGGDDLAAPVGAGYAIPNRAAELLGGPAPLIP